MDPNANLKEQLEIVESIYAGRVDLADVNRLADLITALNQWLASGGSLPEAWQFEWTEARS